MCANIYDYYGTACDAHSRILSRDRCQISLLAGAIVSTEYFTMKGCYEAVETFALPV